jgi:signal transduction histidine kinase
VKRVAPLIFLLYGCVLVVQAQNRELIDSLKRAINRSSGIEKFHALNDLGFEYRLSYPDSTIFFCEKAYNLGKSLNLQKELARSLSFIGLAKKYKGDYKGAFQYSLQAVEIARQQEDSVQLAYCHNNFGRLFFDQGDITRAYDNFIVAQQIFERLDDKSGLAYVYRSLSDLYKSQNDYQKALDMSLKANRLRLEIGEPRTIISSFAELGAVYGEMKSKLDAIRCFEQADSLAQKTGDEISSAEIKLGLGEFLVKNEEFERAAKLAVNAHEFVVKTGNERLLPRAEQLLGVVTYNQGNLPLAISYFNKVIASTEKRYLDLQRDAYFHLSKIYEKQGRQAEATQATIKYLILKESLQNVELARQIEKLQFQLEIEKRESENAILRASQHEQDAVIKQQRLQNIILVVVAFFASLLFAIQWRFSKKSKEKNEQLAKQNIEIAKQDAAIRKQNEKLERHNQELSDINHEKNTLMSIVVHDLKAPMNRIRGLAELVEMEGNLNESQKKYISHVRDSTRTGLDLIADLLDVNSLEVNNEPHLSVFSVNDFIADRINTFRHYALAKQSDIHVHGSVEEVSCDRDYLTRIIDNLLSNAIKFSPRGSMIGITLTDSEQEFMIAIHDQGPGFSDDDKRFLFQKFKRLSARPTAGESSNGLGLAIVKLLVERLRGSVELQTEHGKGSVFTVKIPKSL